jgi:small subunit ribosomal protein S9
MVSEPSEKFDGAEEAAAAPEPEARPLSLEESLDIGSRSGAHVERSVGLVRGKIDKFGVAWGTGRRKTAVARVRVKDGNGTITINGRPLEAYFPSIRDQKAIEAPLRATDMLNKVDITANVDGGGSTGQSGAVVLGIARALQVKNENLHGFLSEGGFLTRDGRMVERKKYGRRKARRSFQFSKR